MRLVQMILSNGHYLAFVNNEYDLAGSRPFTWLHQAPVESLSLSPVSSQKLAPFSGRLIKITPFLKCILGSPITVCSFFSHWEMAATLTQFPFRSQPVAKDCLQFSIKSKLQRNLPSLHKYIIYLHGLSATILLSFTFTVLPSANGTPFLFIGGGQSPTLLAQATQKRLPLEHSCSHAIRLPSQPRTSSTATHSTFLLNLSRLPLPLVAWATSTPPGCSQH